MLKAATVARKSMSFEKGVRPRPEGQDDARKRSAPRLGFRTDQMLPYEFETSLDDPLLAEFEELAAICRRRRDLQGSLETEVTTAASRAGGLTEERLALCIGRAVHLVERVEVGIGMRCFRIDPGQATASEALEAYSAMISRYPRVLAAMKDAVLVGMGQMVVTFSPAATLREAHHSGHSSVRTIPHVLALMRGVPPAPKP